MSRIDYEAVIMGRKVQIIGDRLYICRNEEDIYRFFFTQDNDETIVEEFEKLAETDARLADRYMCHESYINLIEEFFMNSFTERLDTWEESEIRRYIEVRTGYRKLKGDSEEWAG